MILTSILLILAGLVVLYFGAEWLVKGAGSLAIRLGMTPLIAGLTVVAFGISSPELVVSLVAAFNGSGDIALGYVIGSNIFHILGILGLSGMIAGPLRGPGIKDLDLYFMMGVSVVLLPLLRTGYRLARWEGGLLLATYGVYLFLIWPR